MLALSSLIVSFGRTFLASISGMTVLTSTESALRDFYARANVPSQASKAGGQKAV